MTNDERAQIRAEAIHDCLDALPKPSEKYQGMTAVAFSNKALRDCADAICALLRPDPAEVSEPLQSAQPKRAPVDHGPGAAAHGEAGTLHEPTVRACIAKLPATLAQGLDDGASWRDGMCTALAASYGALLSLLPKPDPAKELVEEWLRTHPANSDTIEHVQGGSSFARWAIDTGRLSA